MALLEGRRYRRVLEIGCGAGVFTRRLVTIADFVLAIDVAPGGRARSVIGMGYSFGLWGVAS